MLKAEWGLFIFKLVKKYMEAVVKSQGKKELAVFEDKKKAIAEHERTKAEAQRILQASEERYRSKAEKAKEILDITAKEKEKAQKFAEKLNDFMEV